MQYRLKCDVHVFPPQLYLTVSHHTLNRPFLLHIFFMFATHVLYNFYMFFPIFSTFSLYMFFTQFFLHIFELFSTYCLHHFLHYFSYLLHCYLQSCAPPLVRWPPGPERTVSSGMEFSHWSAAGIVCSVKCPEFLF